MNHVFVGERFLLWFQLGDFCSCQEGSAVFLSVLTFTLCVGAAFTAQSAVKACATVSSRDTATWERGWHYNQVMRVEDYRNPCLSDVNDMQLSCVSPKMNLLFGTWTFSFPQYVKQWILWRPLRCWTTDACWEKNHTTLHFITKVYFCSLGLVLLYLDQTERKSHDGHIKRMTLTFLPGPDLILSSTHSIFGHTHKKLIFKTTELHFFLGESYLINQKLGEERINVCSRWGENHLRKQWKRRLKADKERKAFRVKTDYLSFQRDRMLLEKGKPGELFHRPSPLSEWSLQSGPLEFLHHVI